MKITFYSILLLIFGTSVVTLTGTSIAVVEHPTNASVDYLANHVLNCTFESTVNCFWTNNAIPVKIEDRYHYLTGSNTGKDCSLRIDAFRKIDAGLWQCHGQIVISDRPINSRDTELAWLQLYIPPAIMLSGMSPCHPEAAALSEEGNMLTCIAAYGGEPPRLQWELDGEPTDGGSVTTTCDSNSYCNASITWPVANVGCQDFANSSGLKCFAYYEHALMPLVVSLKGNENLETEVAGRDEKVRIIVYALLSVAAAIVLVILVIAFVFITMKYCRCDHSEKDCAATPRSSCNNLSGDTHLDDRPSIQHIRNSLYKQTPSSRTKPDVLPIDQSRDASTSPQLTYVPNRFKPKPAVRQLSSPQPECTCHSPVLYCQGQNVVSDARSENRSQVGHSRFSSSNNVACKLCDPAVVSKDCPAGTLYEDSCCTCDNSRPGRPDIYQECKITTPKSSEESLCGDCHLKWNDNPIFGPKCQEAATEGDHCTGNDQRGFCDCSDCDGVACPRSCTHLDDTVDRPGSNPAAQMERPASNSTYTEIDEDEMQHHQNSLYDDCSCIELVDMRRKC